MKYCNFFEEGSLIARLKKVQDFLDWEASPEGREAEQKENERIKER